jgi:hypothetical protein
MPAAWFIGYWQQRTHNTSGQKWIICIGLLVSTLGFGIVMLLANNVCLLNVVSGLFTLLDEHASTVAQTAFPLIAGIGLGMLFHAPYQVFARAMKPTELATGTSAFFLVRFTGATVGLVRFDNQLSPLSLIAMQAVAGAIFYARASNRMPPQISDPFMNYSLLHSIQPLNLREQVLRILSTSVQVFLLSLESVGVTNNMTDYLDRLRSVFGVRFPRKSFHPLYHMRLIALKISLLVKTMPIYDGPDDQPGTPATTKNSTEV